MPSGLTRPAALARSTRSEKMELMARRAPFSRVAPAPEWAQTRYAAANRPLPSSWRRGIWPRARPGGPVILGLVRAARRRVFSQSVKSERRFLIREPRHAGA